MKKIIEIIGGIAITGFVVMFLLNLIFNGELFGSTEGIFGMGRRIPSSELSDSQNHQAAQDGQPGNQHIPEVEYTGLICVTEDETALRSLFQVKTKASGSFLPGEQEEGFYIKVVDILDDAGRSYYRQAEEESDDNSEEIISPVYYNKQNGLICFHEAGVYTIKIRVVEEGEGTANLQFKVPVELYQEAP